MSDQERISPYNINTISTRKVMGIKKNINLGIISRSNTKFSELTNVRIVWLTARRITNLIWELKSQDNKLIVKFDHSSRVAIKRSFD